MKGDISSPGVFIDSPRLTGTAQLPFSSSTEYHKSLPPKPPGLLLEKKSILPSALIDGVDSHALVFIGGPRL